MRELLRNKWVKFGIVGTICLLWIIWVECWWLLLLLPIIFDVYITKKVHWAFWKKKDVERQTKTVEWIDAIIFAVIGATLIRMFLFEAYTIPTSSMEKTMLVGDYLFVSKVAYGPKLPNTPLALPFTHNKMPLAPDLKPYSEAIHWDYRRIAGLSEIKRNDIMVFNFPAGDTVPLGYENPDYYSQLRTSARAMLQQWHAKGKSGVSMKEAENLAREMMRKRYKIVSRPVDKRENYIKRGVGMPGDTLQLKNGVLYVNGIKEDTYEGLQYDYVVKTNGIPLNKKRLKDDLGISYDDFGMISNNAYVLPMTSEMLGKLKKYPNIQEVERVSNKGYNPDIFPFSDNYRWNVDNFGPMYVPKKGVTVSLTPENLPFYERIIDVYEENVLAINDNVIYINGKPADSYTFKMDYFWMMGDNRHRSADSRYFGFVPEDHVVGKASFIWLSLDSDYSFPKNIRWRRLFKFI
ncbi:MAG: S26 family signal peptidase [Culturomica sp.]|jgi:signal peptidase I|nr:S26 family signal peptidase [Culturomica sp.]